MPPVWPGVCQEYSYSWLNFMSGRGQRRQHHLQVAADRRRHAPADEGRGVLERPDVLVDHLHHVDRDRRGLAALRHQEDRDLVVPRADELEQLRAPWRGPCRRPGSSPRRMAWMAESETTTDMPSSARRRLDDLDRRGPAVPPRAPAPPGLRPSGSPSSSSTTSARMLRRLVLRWIMSTLRSDVGVVVTPARRVPPEERRAHSRRLAEPLRVQRPELRRSGRAG